MQPGMHPRHSESSPDTPALVLLRQKFERLYFVIGAQQQGHRGKLATRASINRRRMVAMEFGM